MKSINNSPLLNSEFRELTNDEATAVSGGWVWFVVMAVARFGLANASH